MKHTIDAKGKKLGRIASEAALLLRGKGTAGFTPNEIPETTVEIINASKLSMTEKKQRDTDYTRYSGYPGGLKYTTLGEYIDKKGYRELLRKVILGMLPRNRQRAKIIRHLTVKD